MAYSICAACGAKTLVGATRCPRCQTPLVSYDADAKRPETVRCSSCGVLRPVAIGVCPNCHSGPEPAARRSLRGLLIAAGAIVAILVVGFTISKIVGPAEPNVSSNGAAPPVPLPDREGTDSIAVGATKPDTSVPVAAVAPSPVAAPRAAPIVSPAPPPVAQTAGSAPRQAAAVIPTSAVPAPAPDSGWTYWRATTWVRLRDKPGRNGEEVRMIDSAQRVLLGPSANGWREARVGTDRGWVDPRLFAPATKP